MGTPIEKWVIGRAYRLRRALARQRALPERVLLERRPARWSRRQRWRILQVHVRRALAAVSPSSPVRFERQLKATIDLGVAQEVYRIGRVGESTLDWRQ